MVYPRDPMSNPDLRYWMAFARVPRVGGKRTRLLEQHFGTMREACEAPRLDLQAAGLDESTLRSVLRSRTKVDPDQELTAIERAGIAALTWNDRGSPRLKEIDDAPPVLFVQGSIEERDEWSVVVVGTRRVSAYGRQMAEELSRGLATNLITVVSGLARGVDGIAHQAALDAGGGLWRSSRRAWTRSIHRSTKGWRRRSPNRAR